MNDECPICLEAFTEERPAKGPSLSGCSTECSHCICEQCGDDICEMGMMPPFACPICRRDYTQWFVDEFCWQPPLLRPTMSHEQLCQIVEFLWPQIENSGDAGLMEACLRILAGE